MNDLQKKQLELLKVFINICERLELKYYLVCGTALGAVKYHGFIPWDDDVDVALKREEYEVFLEKAPELLPKHYFLQNLRTEEAFPLLMTKLRDSETTLIEESYSHLPINHGVYIDIFPLDGYPNGYMERKKFEVKKWIYNKARCVAYIYGYRFWGLNRIMIKYEVMLKKYSCLNSNYICNHANCQKKIEYAPKEQYGEGRIESFEGLKVIVPEKAEEYLMQKYGDWKKEPIVKKSHHCFRVCDVEKSFLEYL